MAFCKLTVFNKYDKGLNVGQPHSNMQKIKQTNNYPKRLNSIKELSLPLTIATGSYATNVDFYFEHLKLNKWFERSLVVLNDGTYPGKPAPNIFKIAAQKLSFQTSECIVFEDSYSGNEAAHNAGIGKIIAVEPKLNANKFSIPTKDIEFCNGFTKLDMSFLSGLKLVLSHVRDFG